MLKLDFTIEQIEVSKFQRFTSSASAGQTENGGFAAQK